MGWFRPTPEALEMIRIYRKQILTRRRARPCQKQLCAQLGIAPTTLRKFAKKVQP